MRMIAIHAQTERKRLDRSVRCAEKRRPWARKQRLRGLIRPDPAVCATAGAACGRKSLSSARIQAIFTSNDTPLGECRPKCGDGILQRKTGPYSLFDACSRYPECDYTKRILTSEPKEHAAHRQVRLQEPISEGAICPTCGRGKMVVRKDRNDQEFLACSAFPKCKTTAAFREGEQKSIGNGGNI